MSKELKNKVDSIRRTLKNNALEVSGTAIEMKILELYPNYETDWNSDTHTEVIKAITKDHQSTEIVNVIMPTTAPTLTQHQEAETRTEQETMDDRMQMIAPLEEDNNEGAIASDEIDYSDADKRALTVQKSQELGITLSNTEINLIADSIEQCGESLDELLNGIQSALVAYINHKTSQNTQKIDSALDAVVDYAEQKFNLVVG